MSEAPQPLNKEHGSITLLALWSLAIIGMLLAAATFSTRVQLKMTANAIAESRLRLAAQAGTQLGLARLLRRRSSGPNVFFGTPKRWRDGLVDVEVAIVDEAGKVDLNEAPPELLSGLLVALGRSHEDAAALACNILDRRGTADEICQDRQQGGDRERAPSRFVVPEELGQVRGFDDLLYGQIADYITVATRASAIDPLVASRPVLLAIPGVTEAVADNFIDMRERWREIPAGGIGFALPGIIPFITTSPQREFTITAMAMTTGRARYRADLQVRLTDIATHPFDIIALRAPPVDRGNSDVVARPQRVP